MAHLIERIGAAWPPEKWIDVHVVVAVSGGADSMALLRTLLDLKRLYGGSGQLVAAHVNHQIHENADADEEWLVGQLRSLGVRHEVRRVETRQRAAQEGDGLEAAARALRYGALEAVAAEVGARYLATAHTADDQAETVLHRILRGTGIDGLAGIPRQRALGPLSVLVRPLLHVTRREVLEYLVEVGQGFREDPTNREEAYTRNRIRLELLPLLRSRYNPQIDEAILRLARQAEELSCILQAHVSRILGEAVEISGEEIVVDAARLRREPEPLVREVLRRAWRTAGWPEQQMSDSAWRRLSQLMHVEVARADLPGGVEAKACGEVIRLLRARS